MIYLTIAMAPGGGQQGSMGIAAFLPMLVIIVIFYLLMVRPQSKRQKEHEKLLSELTKGDRVVTTGGMHGVVQRVNEKEGTIVVKIADDVKVELDRGAIARKISDDTSGD